jgi:hypothetical protein
MDARERRQFEMLLRVDDFGATYRHLFAAPRAPQTFAEVAAAVAALKENAVTKLSASAAARADRTAEARVALVHLLSRVSQLARVLRAEGQELPPFPPPASKSDQALLIAGRHFAQQAKTADTEFAEHGMGSAVIEATTMAFAAALRDRGTSRADRIAARTRIQVLVSSALKAVRRLDLMVQNELAHDNVVQATWKQARHVESARRTGDSTAAPAHAVETAGGSAAAPSVTD